MTAPRLHHLVLVLAAGCALAACSAPAPLAPGPSAPAAAPAASTAAHGITYTITSTVPATITYIEGTSGSVKTVKATSFPWTKTIDVPDTFPRSALLGSTGEANGSITCTITDSTGRVIKTAKASGVVAVASCDGSKP